MTAKTFRAAAVALALSFAAQAAAEAPARATEQDTTDGVAPAKPGHPAEQPAPAADHASTTGPAESADHGAPAARVAGSGPAPSTLPPAPAQPPAAAAPAASEAQRYCDNIAAVAAEARFAWQTRKLTELQGQVAGRIAELEKKQAELEASLTRRDEAMRKARDTLITVYAKMDPEAAAGQLALLDDGLAAAVLAQLTPKQSSLILNEIKPERASQLAAAMTTLPAPEAKTDKKS